SKVIMSLVVFCEIFPQEFVTSHVLVKTLLQELPVVVLLSRFTVNPPQASDPVGGVKFGVAAQSIVAFAPAAPIPGVGQVTVVFFVQGGTFMPNGPLPLMFN